MVCVHYALLCLLYVTSGERAYCTYLQNIAPMENQLRDAQLVRTIFTYSCTQELISYHYSSCSYCSSSCSFCGDLFKIGLRLLVSNWIGMKLPALFFKKIRINMSCFQHDGHACAATFASCTLACQARVTSL